MRESLVDLIVDDRVGRLVLRRADAGNALTTDMMGQVLRALQRAAGEAQILVISGEGNDFCLGRDRKEPMQGTTPSDAFKLVTEINTSLAAFPGIALSAIQGRAFGFGVGLVMRTDIAIASEGARFALDEVKLGIPPMFIMSQILDHLTPKAAFDLISSSREFSAREAYDMGLLSRTVPSHRLQQAVDEVVRELHDRNPRVLSACKHYLSAIQQVPREDRAAYALAAQTQFASQQKH